tara:strand:- start:1155 stop:2012 length:858 start_codon:yes stop_codon:yes gene_type:complete
MKKVTMLILSFSLLLGGLEIESLNPNEGEAGSSLSVELTASGVDFYDGYSSVNSISFNPAGVTVESFTVSSSNTVSLNLSLDKMPPSWFQVELVGEFYDMYDQYSGDFYDQYTAVKDDAFFVSSNNPLLIAQLTSDNDFGNVNVGETGVIEMTLYNPSTVDLEIYGISMTNPEFSTSDISGISAGETVTKFINFNPTYDGYQENTMTIYSDDEYDPAIVFQMSGNGVGIEGDMNGDGTLNILDIVALINFVFNDNDNPFADLNDDGTVNIVDVVMLVNLVLNWGL